MYLYVCMYAFLCMLRSIWIKIINKAQHMHAANIRIIESTPAKFVQNSAQVTTIYLAAIYINPKRYIFDILKGIEFYAHNKLGIKLIKLTHRSLKPNFYLVCLLKLNACY